MIFSSPPPDSKNRNNNTASQADDHIVKQSTITDSVVSTELTNGIGVYLLENHTNSTVDLMGYIEGGLFVEDGDDQALANLCVSMLDRGTTARSHETISEQLESNGAMLSYNLTPELITFRIRCLSEDLPLLLGLLGETLAEPAFPVDQLKIAKEDARAGLREAAYDTFSRAYESAAKQLLGADHPYARDPMGIESVINRLTAADLSDFHQQSILGSRIQLAIVGDIEPESTKALLEKHLSGVRADKSSGITPGSHIVSSAPLFLPDWIANQAQLPTPVGVNRSHITIPDKEQVDIIFTRPGIARSNDSFDAYGMANFLFGGSFVSRLNKQLRDNEGLTYGAQSALVSGLCPGFWYSYIGVSGDDVEQAITGTLREMKQFAAEGATEEEFATARLHLTGSFPLRLETNRVVAAVLLNGIRIGLGISYIDDYFSRVENISLDQVNTAARDLFNADNLYIVSSGPEPE